ncbi:MAG TPA: N,N-dimethylformamidase beta subunit family domain-containing protein, partial [Opitutaceae bacterium]
MKTAAALAAGGALSGGAAPRANAAASPSTAAPASSSLIADENRRPGATDWQLTRVKLDRAAGVRASAVEGYCSRQSVLAGESLDLFVSTTPAARFKIEIFRTGYYGGRGARLMMELGPFEGLPQPVPKMGEKRLVECRWAKTTSLRIPADWPSGVYLGRLTTLPDHADQPYWQNYVVFIVRDTRRADILLQCSDNTWQAYNKWP